MIGLVWIGMSLLWTKEILRPKHTAKRPSMVLHNAQRLPLLTASSPGCCFQHINLRIIGNAYTEGVLHHSHQDCLRACAGRS